MKGKVLDDDEPIPSKSKAKARPTRGQSQSKHSIHHAAPLKSTSQQVLTKNPFRFPSIKNEEVFESKLQESPSIVNSNRYHAPGSTDDSPFTYSTIKFGGDDDDIEFGGRPKSKAPKRSTSISPTQLFNLEQTFGNKQIKFDAEIDADDDDDNAHYNGGFKPLTKHKTQSKGQKSPGKLFKSTEDEFKDSEFFDFSQRPRPGGSSGKLEKFKSDLGVKSLAIKSYKNKFDPPMQGGFKPSFKLRDFPTLHGSGHGSGVASPGQIKTFYDAEESEIEERLRHKLSNDPHTSTKAQFQQFLKAKEDERLEQLVEDQFKLQQQKQIAHEKEAELKLQHQVLQLQKEKLKQVEKHLNSKATRQSTRQKRRPNSSSRRQRNPSPINFSVASNGKSAIPLRAVTGKDGTYRVSFNVQ